MKIFLDTANINEIREAASWGILDGVTTNPTLVMKEGRDFKEVADEIFKILPHGEISLEVVATDSQGMIKEAETLLGWHKDAVIKVPMTAEGLKAIKQLSAKGVKTNTTLIFSTNQALLAAKAGTTMVSPFVGRLDDIGHDGMQLVRDTVQVFKNYGLKTQVLAASIRHPVHVTQSALAGAHIVTLPFKVLQQMTQHALTDKGLKAFLDDWAKAQDAQRNKL